MHVHFSLKRGPDGAFNDDDIARVLQEATASPAAAYRAQGTPPVLRIVEIMSILQARSWGVCTMNEFRAYLGLKKFETFEEWSSVPEVSSAARQLYGHIDNLELYPGLQAEDCMPLGPGSGICCGYTMTRAILGDAVALVRGDRFYTTDYTRKLPIPSLRLLILDVVTFSRPCSLMIVLYISSCQSHELGLPGLFQRS